MYSFWNETSDCKCKEIKDFAAISHFAKQDWDMTLATKKKTKQKKTTHQLALNCLVFNHVQYVVFSLFSAKSEDAPVNRTS